MQRVVGVLVVVICVVLAIGRVEADPSAAQWKAAEQTLRTQLAAQQVTPLDVTRKVGALGTAFWVREQVGARTVGKLVVVRGSTIFATRSEATLRALLTKDEVLRTRTLTARDLLYLVEQLAALPAGLGNVVTEHKDRTLLPTLRFGKTAKDPATLVLHSFRQTTTP
ncbi:MAG: hypothetical protein NT062_12510 [Proteobacteria bacterium]|nr:hypothetical protein [Pseudomonadota bacterium]